MRGNTAAAPGRDGPAAFGSRRRLRIGVRARVFGWYVTLLALAAVASLLLQRALLDASADRTLDEELLEEERQIRFRIDQGQDVTTGEPWPDLHTALNSFVRRTVPEVGESFITFLEGQLLHDTGQLGSDPSVNRRLRLWAGTDGVQTGELETGEGRIRYRAVALEHGGQEGTLVVTIFTERETDPIADAMRLGAAVWISIVAAASLFAWILAGRVLRPVRDLTEAARSITDTDLTRRIDVRGSDEIAELAARFNAMLDRLEVAFATQRAFLNDAGHELRTPITIVRGHLELMGTDPDEQRETLTLVTEELDRMSRYVADLLLLATAERTDFLRPKVVDIQELTNRLFANARALGARRWRLEACGRGTLTADSDRLTQAVMNLADNAARHTTEHDEIVLGSDTVDEYVRFWVHDTGPGIPPADQERIFERFARGGDIRRRDGSGLGLAIVRAIAVAHGGRVELVSHPGQGTTFTIVVPRHRRRAADHDPHPDRRG